jgi:hypothetical protein
LSPFKRQAHAFDIWFGVCQYRDDVLTDDRVSILDRAWPPVRTSLGERAHLRVLSRTNPVIPMSTQAFVINAHPLAPQPLLTRHEYILLTTLVRRGVPTSPTWLEQQEFPEMHSGTIARTFSVLAARSLVSFVGYQPNRRRGRPATLYMPTGHAEQAIEQTKRHYQYLVSLA